MSEFTVIENLEMPFKINSINALKQFLIILPIWIIGFFWSPESAFYVTAAICPMIFSYIVNKDINIRKKIFIFFLFPTSILLLTLCISLFYLINIGHLPDYYSFIEGLYKEYFLLSKKQEALENIYLASN